jgi:hypothetical protein
MKAQLKETRNYDLFEVNHFNRDVEKVRNLERSMKEHGYIAAYPLHVIKNGGDKLSIKAGHHRFHVARALNIPVKYVVCQDQATIHQLEAATNQWKLSDYLTSYVRTGAENYIPLKQYHEATGITLSQCASLLADESAGSGNQLEDFKAGKFKAGDTTHAAIIAEIVIFMQNHGIAWAANCHFVQALSRIARVKEFDPKIFKQKAKAFKNLFEKKPHYQGYQALIEEIYNRHNKNRVPLVFLADETAKQRCAVKGKK